MHTTTTLSLSDIEATIVQALEGSNVSTANAASVARSLVAAEADGQKGHGLSRVASYAGQARSGKVDGHAVPDARQTRPASLLIDARHGFAYPAIDLAIERLQALSLTTGVAAAAIANSHHFGVAGHPCERLADRGLVAIAVGNTPSAMAAWGGRRAVFGTNPIAFAAPCAHRAPVVIDLALSEVARGKIMTAAAKDEAIPEGWARDAEGRPTTDARAALGGTLLPAGGAKGAALALMVEILAAALTGSNFAFEASSFFEAHGQPPAVGQVLLTFDPAAFSPDGQFAERVALLAAAIEQDGDARLPGSRRTSLRAQARRDGVAVDSKLLAEIRALAQGIA